MENKIIIIRENKFISEALDEINKEKQNLKNNILNIIKEFEIKTTIIVDKKH